MLTKYTAASTPECMAGILDFFALNFATLGLRWECPLFDITHALDHAPKTVNLGYMVAIHHRLRFMGVRPWLHDIVVVRGRKLKLDRRGTLAISERPVASILASVDGDGSGDGAGG